MDTFLYSIGYQFIELMENSAKENTPQNQSNTTPKPSEDVQLTIETVTPDTEKDVVPTQVQQDSSNKDETQSDDEQKPETEEIENTSDTDSAENDEEQNTEIDSDQEEQATDEPESDQESTLDDDDERNQIETVSP